MEHLADKELALAAARGDEQAFVKIVQNYQAMVTGITLGVLGNFAASEDAAQDQVRRGNLRHGRLLSGVVRVAAAGTKRQGHQ